MTSSIVVASIAVVDRSPGSSRTASRRRDPFVRRDVGSGQGQGGCSRRRGSRVSRSLELGGVEPVKESVRAGRHGALLDDVGRDVRYAFRLFARQPTFAAVIVGTLALGIGANTAIFSIIDGLLLRTLPVEDPERLAQLVAAPPSGSSRGPIRSGRRSSATPRGSTARLRGPVRRAVRSDAREARPGSSMACGPAPEPSTCSASSRRSAACSSHPTMPAAAAAEAGRRDQPRVLADAFRRRTRRDRPHADARARAAHDRGRDAAWILRAAPGGRSTSWSRSASSRSFAAASRVWTGGRRGGSR